MLYNISWGSYFIAIGIVFVVYYTIVILLYYRPEMQRILTHSPFQQNTFFKKRPGLNISESDSVLFPEVHLLMEELQQLITFSAQNSQSREYFLNALRTKLSDHKHLVGSAFYPAINNFLKEESAKQCSIHFSEDDLGVIWKKSEEH